MNGKSAFLAGYSVLGVGLVLLLSYRLLRAFWSGQVPGRLKVFERDKDPSGFWFTTAAYGGGVILLAGALVWVHGLVAGLK